MHIHAMFDSDSASLRLLACLSDPSRHHIVRALGVAERCVSDLAREVRLSQSCTTRHLQALGREGLVERRREGKRVIYRLKAEEPHLRALFAWAAGVDGTEAPVVPSDRPPRRKRIRAGRRGASPAEEPRSASIAEPEDGASESGEQNAAEAEGEPEPEGDASPMRPGDIEDYLL
jgi:DNA-binding transcriptional ArsR family regulator